MEEHGIKASQKELIDELLSNYQKIPVIDTTNLSGAALAWAKCVNRLRELISNDDPMRFLQWDVIRTTMFIGNESYTSLEWESLKNSNIFDEYWKKAIIESEVGFPTTDELFNNSSGTLIHHAYHIQQFEEKTNTSINNIDFVFEFGGGYGSMCRLFKNLGFNNKYVIFDLPEFSLLQTYYLKSMGYKLLTVDEFCNDQSGILCISDLEDLKNVLKNIIPLNKNLFIGTWSISETPMNLRNYVFQLVKNFNLFLLAYQHKFEEVDNVNYFSCIKDEYSHIRWNEWKIKHIPASSYLIGNGT